jgi:hypothetical protein
MDQHERIDESTQPVGDSASGPRPSGFSAEPHSIQGLHRAVGNRAVGRLLRSAKSPLPLLRAAASDPSTQLDTGVRKAVEGVLGHRIGDVRVHSGPASDDAASAIGARAYTIGADVYLGREARRAGPAERRRLLAHETAHTVQQGGGAIALRDTLRVGGAQEPSEREAEAVAEAVSSPALALRRRVRLSSVAPAIQRDLINDYDVTEGKFKLNLTTESHAGAKSGMSGTIKFIPNATAPDSTSIRLFQALRFENLTTGGEVAWPGAYAGRANTQTAADPTRGIEPGWGIDHDPTAATPRTTLADPDVSIYYRRWWPNATSSQDGSKQGATISEASLWDYPGTSGPNVRFSFETVAQASDTGHVYGSVAWGFTVSDVSKGEVTGERAVGRNVTLANTDEALRRYNEYYRNRGASTAPTK